MLQCTEKTIFVVARPLLFFVRLLRPFTALMNGLGNAFVRVLSLQATSEQANMHSIEELEMLVLDVQEATFLRQVFDFGDKTVQQVMVPRTEIVGVAVSSSLEQVQVMFAQEQYTPAGYEASVENIVGMVHLKDVFTRSRTPRRLNQRIRPPCCTQSTMCRGRASAACRSTGSASDRMAPCGAKQRNS